MLAIYLGIFSAVFFWGSAFVGITICLKSYSPEALVLGRVLIASTIALILYITTKNKTPFSWTDRIKAGLLGVIGIGIYSLALAIGERTVPAGISAFLVGQMPLIASILASIFLKEKVNTRLWIGIGVSIAGLLFITLGESSGVSLGSGILCVMSSAFSGAAYTCLQKPLLKRMPTTPFICHALWGATLFLIAVAICSGTPFFSEIKHAQSSATLSLIYLGCFPSIIAYLGWTYAISKVNIAKAGILLYGMPIVGGLLAWLMLNEQPPAIALIGMALAFSGSLIGTVKFKKRPKPVQISLTSLQEEA